ncbi:DUF6884 domain-containing protein [Pyrococcus sp. ST04]|uniref:DUF6884 domain-containing protein n=1 Tax=Pyrococcus sp. ST04 TaxID=1183377 RepID=UPI00069456BC|nr:DUF6884 domain-containing protein [Pyrococcus sp. ST04]
MATCGARKIWDVDKLVPRFVEARRAYVGPLAKKTIQYCEKFHPGSYVILSAKYGFLLPHEKIENHDARCGVNPKITIEKLRDQAYMKKINGIRLIDFERVIVLAGKCYCNWAYKVFGKEKVVCPLLRKGGIGLFHR